MRIRQTFTKIPGIMDKREIALKLTLPEYKMTPSQMELLCKKELQLAEVTGFKE